MGRDYTRIIKLNISLILVLIVASCGNTSSELNNPSGLNPNKLTEDEIYNIWGLEAPPDVYLYISNQINYKEEFISLCKEKKVNPYVNISFSVKNEKITDLKIKFSDYSPEIDSLLIKALLNKKVKFSFMSKKYKHYDFRIDMIKLCKGSS